ncbi:tetratricopeptide repeat protein [Butyrivibrio sp. VCB2006]|uniref:tetratricopeptide repeat protein n=1 Tax=Butyrivibrio sp. VCB2006 TaxID=1280679 RepID=UPI0003FBF0B8|nr:tetratricopeptide repeat protein [Butyrivibrio sp. VCB2006]
MKKRVVAAIMCVAFVMTGCGSLAGRHNIDSGFTYIESRDYVSALESFEAATEKGEDECLIHRGIGIVKLQTGDYQSAVDELLASLAADEGIVDDMDFDTNFYLAEAYYRLGDYAKAKEVYDAILALRSKDSNAYYLRGVCELASGGHDSAYSDFSKAIALNSRDYGVIILIYKSLAEYGYEDEARNILQTAMDNGSSFMTNYEKGQISYYLGNNADAQSYLELARNERDQEKEPVVLMLGQTGEKQGDYNYAISVYKTYLNENPESATVYNQLGMCQIKQGDYDGAISSFEAGLTVDDKGVNQALRLNEITAYEYMGQFNMAQSLMATYLQDYPGDETAIRENIFLSTR